MNQPQHRIAHHLAFATLIGLLCWLTFSQVRQFEFVGYDDPLYVGNSDESRIIGEGLTADGLRWIWTASAVSLWEPLSYLSHMCDVQLWGNDAQSAGGHHLTNLILHVVNAVLLYWFLFLLAGNRWAALIAAALFAVHPLRAESVAWVSERKGILCATFVISSLATYLLYVRRARYGWLVASVLLTGLAMMTKPVAVVVPLLLGLMDIWPLKRCGFEEERPPWQDVVRRQVTEKWPYVLMAGSLAAVSIYVQYGSHEEKFIGAPPLLQRLTVAPAGLLFYLQRTMWPTRLTFEYPYPSQLYILAGFGFVALATWWLCGHRDKCWPLLFGWLWFLACWVPVSGLAYVGNSFTNDRYTYLPHIGLLVGCVLQAVEWSRNDVTLARLGVIAGLVVIATLIPITRDQTDTWRNDVTLFQQTITARPHVGTGYTNLAIALEKRGRAAEAIPLLEHVARVEPNYTVYYNLARLYARDPQRVDQAETMYRKAIEENPKYAVAWHNLGLIELRRGDLEQALVNVEHSCELTGHSNSLFLNSLAQVLIKRNELDRAREVVRQAVTLPVDRPEVKRSLLHKVKLLSQPARPNDEQTPPNGN